MLLSKHMGGEPKFAEPYLTKLPHGLVEQLNSSRMVKPEQIKIASPKHIFIEESVGLHLCEEPILRTVMKGQKIARKKTAPDGIHTHEL